MQRVRIVLIASFSIPLRSFATSRPSLMVRLPSPPGRLRAAPVGESHGRNSGRRRYLKALVGELRECESARRSLPGSLRLLLLELPLRLLPDEVVRLALQLEGRACGVPREADP